ncbi:MAG: hypothetical protein CMO47_10505 [Verrucomicrobiales bacterium]|mgnify:CR=1 FL=1|nr:hypothetical protein [Verrucomicrobiales bacterium]
MTFRDLQKAGWLTVDRVDEAREWLCQGREEENRLPWVARFSMGLGAWFAGLFAIGFLALLFSEFGSVGGVGFIVLGLTLLGSGIRMIRLKKHVFLDQFALVLSFAGYGMASIGAEQVWRGYEDFLGSLLVSLFLCPLVYGLASHIVLRFMSVGWTWIAALSLASSEESLSVLLISLALGLAFVFLILSGRAQMRTWRPALIATLLGIFAAMWIMSGDFFENSYRVPFYREAYPVIGMVMGLGFVCPLWWLQRGQGLKSILALAVFALVGGAIGYFGGPGVGVALGLMAVAHARRDYWLGSIAVFALTGFMILFYYHLGVSLMTKSLSLMGAGVATLLLSFLIWRSDKYKDHKINSAA